MISNSELHRIRTGEATPDEARQTLRTLLIEDEENSASEIYNALRSWTWKALYLRRSDEELESWYHVIKAVSMILKRSNPMISAFIETLAHLVDDSIRYSQRTTSAPQKNFTADQIILPSSETF